MPIALVVLFPVSSFSNFKKKNVGVCMPHAYGACGARLPVAGITGSCKSINVGTRTQTQVLWRISKCF